ncbi:H+-ATPase G subunit-domain-containing protein [Jackrogersella minutella]|nr:H+-ATPase G subunit-domain-containing protein [Jackrogersella minutella]
MFVLPILSRTHGVAADRTSNKLNHQLTVRTKRVREARDEAKKEIEAYRRSKDEEFKKFEAEHTQGNKQAEDEANKEADAKITEIHAAGKKSQGKVVEDLLNAVFEVKPHPPEKA